MGKAFIKLCISMCIPILLLVVIDFSPVERYRYKLTVEYFRGVYQTAFFLIENELNSVEESEVSRTFENIAQHFVHKLKLTSLESIPKGRLRQDLKQGQYIFFTHDGTDFIARCYGYRALTEEQRCRWVIQMGVDESEFDGLQRDTLGYVYIVEQYFLAAPESSWPELYRRLRLEADLLLELTKIEDLAFDDTQVERLNNKQRIIEKNATGTYIYARLADSQYVIGLGPIPIKKTTWLLNLSLFGAITLGILMGLLIWLFLLWRDLSKLKAQAQEFGQGQFDSRSTLGRYSDVYELSAAFNHMATSVEDLIQTNQNLTNAVAHDLRTPLARLRLAFEMIESNDYSEDKKRIYKNSIQSSLDSLDYLVNQTLVHARYSRIADTKRFKSMLLADMLDGEIEQYQNYHAQIIFNLHVDPALKQSMLWVDPKALLRALDNLINNATRFAKQQVTVSFTQENGYYLLYVDDDGPGIPPSDYDKVFHIYAQLNNKARNHNSGLGLGLAIAQKIANWHGGTMSIAQSPIGGARVIFRWPKKAHTTGA